MEPKELEVIWPGVTVGADPEFELLVNGDTLLPRRVGVEGNGTLGTDGASNTGELRPSYNTSPEMVHATVKRLLRRLYKKINASPYSDVEVRAGAGTRVPLGGHIHIGGAGRRPLDILLKRMDELITTPLNARANAHYRNSYGYGGLSQYREQPHGWEYRSPCSWLAHPALTKGALTIAWWLARLSGKSLKEIDSKEAMIEMAKEPHRTAMKEFYEALEGIVKLERVKVFQAWGIGEVEGEVEESVEEPSEPVSVWGIHSSERGGLHIGDVVRITGVEDGASDLVGLEGVILCTDNPTYNGSGYVARVRFEPMSISRMSRWWFRANNFVVTECPHRPIAPVIPAPEIHVGDIVRVTAVVDELDIIGQVGRVSIVGDAYPDWGYALQATFPQSIEADGSNRDWWLRPGSFVVESCPHRVEYTASSAPISGPVYHVGDTIRVTGIQDGAEIVGWYGVIRDTESPHHNDGCVIQAEFPQVVQVNHLWWFAPQNFVVTQCPHSPVSTATTMYYEVEVSNDEGMECLAGLRGRRVRMPLRFVGARASRAEFARIFLPSALGDESLYDSLEEIIKCYAFTCLHEQWELPSVGFSLSMRTCGGHVMVVEVATRIVEYLATNETEEE